MPTQSKPRTKTLPFTLWEGPTRTCNQLARANRELLAALFNAYPDWGVSIASYDIEDAEQPTEGGPVWAREFAFLPRTQVTVRGLGRPDAYPAVTGSMVSLVNWEYWSAPTDWVNAVQKSSSQVWCRSEYQREGLIASGISGDQVFVVPDGVDTERFSPSVAPLDLDGPTGFRFLFTGSEEPQAVDRLIEAYVEEFTPDDDTVLVLADWCGFYYSERKVSEALVAAMNSSDAPRIHILTAGYNETQLAGLFAACDCYVQPFGADGLLDAMASGLPSIVPHHGSALDYATATTAFFTEADVLTPEENDVNLVTTVDSPKVALPNIGSLRRQMRFVYENQAKAKATGERARRRAVTQFTWDKAAEVAAKRLLAAAKTAAPTGSEITVDQLRAYFTFREGYPVAKAFLERQLEYGKDPETFIALGKLQLELGLLDASNETHSRALAEFPDDPEINYQVGFARLFTNREAEAFEPLMKAWQTGSQWERNGTALKQLRDHFRARADLLTRHRGFAPDSPEVTQATNNAEAIKQTLEANGWEIQDRTPVGTSLSVCMIVKNEEAFLANCLGSVADIADEIVVVDTGSTDRTVEIARDFGAKVLNYEWDNDFSAARNASMAAATGDWVLILDADEALDPTSRESIEEALCRPHFGGYLITIVNVMDPHNPADLFTHRTCRLVRRLEGIEFEGRIHEQLMQSIARTGLAFASITNAFINHYGYQRQVVQSRNKIERTLEMLHKEIADDPTNWFQVFNLGNTYYCAGDYEKTIETLESVVDTIPVEQDTAAAAYDLLCNALINLNRTKEALKFANRGIQRGINGAPLHYSKAVALLWSQRYQEAYEEISTCRERGWKSQTIGDYSVLTYKGDYVMGEALLGLGRAQEAEAKLREAVKVAPSFAPALFSLGNLCGRTGRIKEAEEYFERSSSHPVFTNLRYVAQAEMYWRNGLLAKAFDNWHEAVGRMNDNLQVWEAWYRSAQEAHDWREVVTALQFRSQLEPASADMLVDWGRALFAMGQWEEAITRFRQAIEQDPGNPNGFFNAGDALYHLGAFTEACECYQAALRLNPLNDQGWFVMGNTLMKMNLPEGARMAFTRALDINPGNEAAANNLEYVQEYINTTAA